VVIPPAQYQIISDPCGAKYVRQGFGASERGAMNDEAFLGI